MESSCTGSPKTGRHEAVATFAQGCFWHSEIVFQSLTGVRDAVSGFAGGKTINPGVMKKFARARQAMRKPFRFITTAPKSAMLN